MRIALAGAGAFGEKHLDGLKNIDGVEDRLGHLAAAPSRRPKWPTNTAPRIRGTDLAEALERDDVDAVILCTPTQMHADQAIQCMDAGKHVQVEIPLADSWADAAGGARQAEGNRPRLHGRPHPPLQSRATSGCKQQIDAGELDDPGDGRADLSSSAART